MPKKKSKSKEPKPAPGVQIVIAAVDAVFSDTRVPPSQTMDRLVEIREDIDMKIECLKSDMRKFNALHAPKEK